ncbi:chitobiase/beta-hexosaminidase C-terminal domain-containing protein [Myxococcaceae bacterium GXIMD 01537]
MSHTWSARCLLALVALQLASACDSNPNPPPTEDKAAPSSRASPAGGQYSSGVTVSLLCDDGSGSGCAATHYTTDGSEPTTASPAFRDALALGANTTLKFFSVDKAGNTEAVRTEQYTFGTSTGGDKHAPTTAASPAGGASNSARLVTLTCSDGTGSGCAATYFTTDGSTPTAQSSRYTQPISVTATTVLKFFSVDKADNAEAVHTETYLLDSTAPTATASLAGDTYGAAQTVTLSCDDGSGSGCAAIHFTTDGSTPTASSPVYAAPLSVAATTTLRFLALDFAGNASTVRTERYVIDTSGPTTTASRSGGVFNFTVSVTLACDDAGGSGCDATFYTTDGTAPTRSSKRYTGAISVTATTTLRFFSVDKTDHEGPRGTETYTLDFAAPVTTVSPPGGNYSATTQVTLSCADTGGSGCESIFFSTNPALPTSSYTLYTAPIALTANTTLKFFSVDRALNREDVRTETYSLDITPPVTTASPKGGAYNQTQQVALSCADGLGTGCSATHYTTDGSTPTTSSPSLTAGQRIPISSNTSLKFFSVDAAGNAEVVKTQIYLIDTQAPTTTASPAGGTYGATQSVTLTCADASGTGCKATHYTVDGTVPTRSSPQFNEASPISITADTVLRFFSVDSVDNAEPVRVVGYTIDTLAPTTTANPKGRSAGAALDVALTCADNGGSTCAGTWYTLDGSAPTESSTAYTAGNPIRVSGTATLRFFSKDAVGNREGTQSESYVIDTVRPTVSASPAGGSYASARGVTLSCNDGTGTGCSGPIWYTTNGSEPTESSAVYSGPVSISATTTLKFFSKDAVGNASLVASESYVIDTVAPTASATPKGGTFGSAVSVSLVCADTGGSGCEALFFTLDGSVPTTGSTRYTTALSVSSTSRVRFIARDVAGNVSAVSTEDYVFDTTPPTVSANPAGRTSNSALSVTLLCDDGGPACKAIHYTLDGSAPTTASTQYTGPVSISSTTTLRFIGVDAVDNVSAARTENYVIDTTPPSTSANPLGGTFGIPTVSVTLTCSDTGGSGCAATYYTLNGSTPTTASPVYTAPLVFSATTTLRFFSVDTAGNAEALRTQTYTMPLDSAAISAQIASARAAADGPISRAIDKALVTYVKPGVGNLTNDPAGFFLQAEREGPAIFVVDPGTLSPAPRPGDRVSLVARQKATSYGQPRIVGISTYSRDSQGESVTALLQDVSAVDLPVLLFDYDSELITLAGTITNTFTFGGTGHVQVALNTVGVPVGSPGAHLLRLRVVATVQEELDLVNGCDISLTAPLWRYNNTAQPSAWAAQDVQVLSCPAPRVVSAQSSSSSTSVRVRFDRFIAPASVLPDGSQFTFNNGLTATSAVVSGREVELTTSSQASGLQYTVTVATSVRDTVGTALDAAATSTTFTGYQRPAVLRINEVAPNVSTLNGDRDLIELLVVQSGTTANMTLLTEPFVVATLPAVNVMAGDIIVVHLDPDMSVGHDAPGSETLSKNEHPKSSYPYNYDSAWDFHGDTSSIAYSSAVLRVRDPVGNTQDAVAFSKQGWGTPPASFPGSLQAIQAEGLWLPADCGGMLCTTTSTPTAMQVSADWTGLGTTRASTVSRWSGADTHSANDWGPATGSASLGLPNP